MKRRLITGLVFCLMLFCLSFSDEPAAAENRSELSQETEKAAAAVTSPARLKTEGEDPDEGAKIDAALTEQGYFRDDIPLSDQEQDFLHTACEEFGVEYALALAVIRQESNFRNLTGDDGHSVGYMQVQEKWHRQRMASLGVTDLTDPYGNFRVGCSYLAELLERCDGSLSDALTMYNSGHKGDSGYSRRVLAFWKDYQL